MTYLREWHVKGTKIRQLPDYLALFTQLTVLNIPKNAITELPPEIGEISIYSLISPGFSLIRAWEVMPLDSLHTYM